MQEQTAVTTFLFTDIEGSSRLWEEQPDRMQSALARHDGLLRDAVEGHRGVVVKRTGDGLHAVFADPLDAVKAAVSMQRALIDPQTTAGVTLRVRCGVHVGVVEKRDGDFFGSVVNRAARIMNAAHGGQVLLSHPVVRLVEARLPADVTLRDLGAVRLRDLAHPERLYQLVHPTLRATFPALRSLESVPNNLPQQVTSFVGRERELAELVAVLGRTRMLTIVGTGGLGKTRLSLQLAAERLEDFPDGVWLIELASLASAPLVSQAVASVLGVKEDADTSVTQALVRHCSDRKLLLVLDNCEHLIDACAELAARLLQAGPDVKVLASSRERINIRGEAVYPLPTLDVPRSPAAASLGAVARTDAVRLFIDRATDAQPSFQASERNAAALVEICRRLDGIPLALELAAARVRSISVEQIAARLDDRFRLLTHGDRAALPRQQTLRALIDWSYDLLSAPEQTLFARLSVFAGGFTLDAVEAVCAGEGLESMDMLDLVAHLVEKSLVMLDAGGDRYDMLETIRGYAAERLASSSEGLGVRNRHLMHYLTLTETALHHLTGPAQGAWLARLDVERENILAAHAFCDLATDGVTLGFRLVHAAKPYWVTRGLWELGYRLGKEALARTRPDDRSVEHCRALFDTGQLACWLGRYGDAQAYLDESLALARALGDSRRIAAALQPLGAACLGQGDVSAARKHLEEAVTLARGQADPHDLAAALTAMAQLLRAQNDVAAAVPIYEQVLDVARSIDDRELIALGSLNLAMAIIDGNASDRVPPMLLEVFALADETGSKPVAQSALEVAAGLAASRGDWQRAARLFGAAEAHAARTGIHRDPADEGFLRPQIDKARHAMGEPAFRAAEAVGRALGYDDARAETRTWLSGSRLTTPDYP